jgi:hypothetical protein
MFNKLMEIFESCSEEFLEKEKDLIISGVSERCLCGAFMLLLRYSLDKSEFSNYHTDIEYNRNFDGQIKTIIDNQSRVINITCDLIIHSRGEIPKQDNLIAIEMKRDTHPNEEKDKDRIRLMALTKDKNDSLTYSVDGRALPQHVCGYLFGAFYEISTNNREIKIEYYKMGEIFNQETIKF